MSPIPNPSSNPHGIPRGDGEPAPKPLPISLPKTPPRPITVVPVGNGGGNVPKRPGAPVPKAPGAAKPGQARPQQRAASPSGQQPVRASSADAGAQRAAAAGMANARKSIPAGAGKSPPMPPEVAAASKTAHVGGYVRIQKVGSGAMGDVFKAWDLREGRWVALKILRSNDMVQLARFVREAQVAVGLNHPMITRVFDAGKDNEKGLWFIAMQFVAGHTLRAFPRSSRRISVQLLRDAAQAIQYAHEKKIVHRDLKPENFMVSSKPKPGANSKSIEGCNHHIFVMDFGIARPSDANTQLTMPGTVMGSPSFMSPEQASGRQVDHRADVYSLGATLYERLAGRPPFESKNIFEALRLVQDTIPTHPKDLDPTIDAKLDAIVMKSLEKDPAKRFQSATELAEALDGWLVENAPAEAGSAKKAGCGKAAVWLLAGLTAAAAAACMFA